MWRETNEEKRALDRLHNDIYSDVRQAAEAHRQVQNIMVNPFPMDNIIGLPNSGAPARAKHAWDRAPYPWNMVNLFSFGCHVIDRAYVRVYRLYGWGRGDYQKEGRGVSGVSWQAHIFNIGH